MERHVHNPEAQSTHEPHLRAGDQGIAYAESPVLLSHRTSVKFKRLSQCFVHKIQYGSNGGPEIHKMVILGLLFLLPIDPCS